MCTMGLGLLFLAVLATLVSCEDPEGNRVFGEKGFTGCPALLAPGWTGLQQRARPLSCPCGERRGSWSWFAQELGAARGCSPHHSRV